MSINHVVIFGGGAAGANILTNLLCTHPAIQYTVVDFDQVELRNITAGTQPYTKTDLNRHKTQALQRLASTQYNKNIKGVCEKITSIQDIRRLKLDLPEKEVLFIDAFDNAPSRNILLQAKCPVIHVGFSASLTGEAVWNESYSEMKESKSDKAIDVCQMHMARPFIMALTAIASLAIAEFIDHGKKINVYFDKTFRIMVF